MVFHRGRKIKRRMFALLLVCLAVWLWWLRGELKDNAAVPVLQPTVGISTEESVCALTLSLRGSESKAALQLFASVCEGMDVRPCIFVTTEWLEKHPELIPSLSYADLGLLYEESPRRITQKRTMAAIASENERFLSLTGYFPRYVKILEDSVDGTVSAALQSYGQTCIGYKTSLSDSLSPGSIVDLGLLDGTTGYALAKFCSNALTEEYDVLPLSELLGAQSA